jgi:membrane peptidoglycan carboxypeptidase
LQGSSIYTTIDLNIQTYGQNYIRSHINEIRKNSVLSYKDRKDIQLAYVTSNPSTGEILSFTGGIDYLSDNQLNRAFQAKRQIGSTIKPFIYLVGLDLKQITPYTVFDDVPIQVELGKNQIWNV